MFVERESESVGEDDPRLLAIQARLRDLDFRIARMQTNMSMETKALLKFIQDKFGSDSQGVIDAQDWLISRPREVSPTSYNQLAEFFAAWDARRQNLDLGRKLAKSIWWGSKGYNPPPIPDGAPVIDLTGSGSGSSSLPPVIDLTGGQDTDVVDEEDDYARLKANQKAGKYVGKFKPFGSHNDEL